MNIEELIKNGKNVKIVVLTKEEMEKRHIENKKRYIESLKSRIDIWRHKKGYSAKMDAWCDKNIEELKKKLLEEGESGDSI